MPNLALAITCYNEGNAGPQINLQGFLAGNAWTGAALLSQHQLVTHRAGCP